MLRRDVLIQMAQDLLIPGLKTQQARIARIDEWYRSDGEASKLPSKATPEHKALEQLARTPWLALVVTNVAQAMFLDSYRSLETPDGESPYPGPWEIFRANGLLGRQVAIHRSMLAYGITHGTALPARHPVTGQKMPRLRGVSPRKMLAWYDDPAEDDWPSVAIQVDRSGKDKWLIKVYDEDAVHYLQLDDRGHLTYIEHRIHGVGLCPVVRFCNQLDLDGRTPGEVEPFIPVAQRINKTTYDKLLTQHFNSWKVRWATGLEEDPDPDVDDAVVRRLRQEDILVNDNSDGKFGALPETPLDGLISAEEQAVKTLAAVSQTPVHAMVGDLINLNAEALAAARATLDAKVSERQHPTGETWAQWLRLGSHILGDTDAAQDWTGHCTWADTSIRSLTAAADSLGKMATMLGIPPEALWGRIPGVNADDVAEWIQMRDQRSSAADDLVDEMIRAGG